MGKTLWCVSFLVRYKLTFKAKTQGLAVYFTKTGTLVSIEYVLVMWLWKFTASFL